MSDFGHVKLTEVGQRKYELCVSLFASLFEALKTIAPGSPELTLAKRDLQTAKMWAAKAIANDNEAKP